MNTWQPITLGGANEGKHSTVLCCACSVSACMDRTMHLAIKTYLVIVSALLTLGNLILTTNF